MSWRVVLVCGLLGLAFGFAWGIADRPVYRATAGVAVESDSQGADQARLERFAQRGESRRVASVAAGLLGGDVSGADLLADVTVRPAPEGGAVVVSAESRSPDYAAAVAEGWAEALVKVEGDPLAAGAAAEIPPSPFQNRSAALWAAIGLAAGLLAGLLFAAILARPPGRWPETEPAAAHPAPDAVVEERAGPVPEPKPHASVPVLGSVSVQGAGPGGLGPVASRLGLDPGGETGTLAVAAVADDDAGARVGVGLALAAADAGTRVLLVDADLEAPAVAGLLDIDAEPGLGDYLVGEAEPRDVVRSVRVSAEDRDRPIDIACIPAGGGNAAGALAEARFEGLAARLAGVYELVVYVTAPAATAEAAAVTRLAAKTVLAVGTDASADAIASADRRLEDAEVAGTIVCEA